MSDAFDRQIQRAIIDCLSADNFVVDVLEVIGGSGYEMSRADDRKVQRIIGLVTKRIETMNLDDNAARAAAGPGQGLTNEQFDALTKMLEGASVLLPELPSLERIGAAKWAHRIGAWFTHWRANAEQAVAIKEMLDKSDR